MGYKAPEILLSQPSDFRSDVWSLGVITYELLCGEMPFTGSSLEQVQERTLTRELTFDGQVWSRVSDKCIDLLKHMLCRDVEARYDIADVLLHPWVIDNF